jgi:hypothetical protein
MPGPAARSVIHLATGRRQGGGDRLRRTVRDQLVAIRADY